MCTLDSDDELGNLLPAHSPSPLSLCEAGHSFILSLILLLFITQTQAETFFFFFFLLRGASGNDLTTLPSPVDSWISFRMFGSLERQHVCWGIPRFISPSHHKVDTKLTLPGFLQWGHNHAVQTQLIWLSHMKIWIQNLVTQRSVTKSPSTEGGRSIHPSPHQVHGLVCSK